MVGLELVTPAMVRALACPYCTRVQPHDLAGQRAAQAAWGWSGALATEGERVVGLLLVHPDGSGSRPAALISALWVAPGHVGAGVGRALVGTAAAGLIRARVGVLQARSGVPATCTAPPAGFLLATGFAPTANASRWRLDLDTTVRAPLESMLDRLGRLMQAVRPMAPPEPARRSAP
ncbi:GNAT family N-acetyltransferase [Micropruina sp.]|uniref:GNAT family N-acetyltransferase n=1 Tax=Micropruina sp. TaxID=2737536 RepID=UPI0039E24304